MELCKELAQRATNVQQWEHAYAVKMTQTLPGIAWMLEHALLKVNFAPLKGYVLVCQLLMEQECLVMVQDKELVQMQISYADRTVHADA